MPNLLSHVSHMAQPGLVALPPNYTSSVRSLSRIPRQGRLKSTSYRPHAHPTFHRILKPILLAFLPLSHPLS